MLILESIRNAVQPPGARTHLKSRLLSVLSAVGTMGAGSGSVTPPATCERSLIRRTQFNIVPTAAAGTPRRVLSAAARAARERITTAGGGSRLTIPQPKEEGDEEVGVACAILLELVVALLPALAVAVEASGCGRHARVAARPCAARTPKLARQLMQAPRLRC